MAAIMTMVATMVPATMVTVKLRVGWDCHAREQHKPKHSE